MDEYKSLSRDRSIDGLIKQASKSASQSGLNMKTTMTIDERVQIMREHQIRALLAGFLLGERTFFSSRLNFNESEITRAGIEAKRRIMRQQQYKTWFNCRRIQYVSISALFNERRERERERERGAGVRVAVKN